MCTLKHLFETLVHRGGICPRRQCRRQCKIFASGVNFSIFTHFFVFLSLKLLKLGEIDGVKFLAGKSVGVKFLTNSMSGWEMLGDSVVKNRETPSLSSAFFICNRANSLRIFRSPLNTSDQMSQDKQLKRSEKDKRRIRPDGLNKSARKW